MLIWNKYLPVYGSAGEPSGGGSPPAEPPSNPSDPNPEAVSASDEWVLGHFDALNADENSEDLDPVEPSAPVEITSQVSAQAGKPEGEIPSPQTGEIPQGQPALATPAVPQVASPPPVPVVGVGANQPVVPQPPAATPAPDPSLIWAQLADGVQQRKAEFIETLAQQYLMSEKEADDLGFTPEQAKFLAKAQARAQVEATASITRMQAEQFPVYLNGREQALSRSRQEEEKFFTLFPGLKEASKAKLAKIFESVTSMHPELKGDEWKKKAGEIAHVSLGIPIQAPQANGQGNAPQAIRTPGPIVRQVNGLSHLPAGTSTAPAPVAQQKSESERFFELLQMTDSGAFDQ